MQAMAGCGARDRRFDDDANDKPALYKARRL